jgi:protein gp37
MADNTSIEWTDATWNPIRARNKATCGIGHFCVHMSEGCRFCYAERLQPRFRNPIRFAAQDRDKVEIYLDEDVLLQPLRWRRPRRIFPCSMTDLFGDWVTDDMLDRIFAVMALAPQHTFQVLTKRAERLRDYLLSNDIRERLAEHVLGLSPDPRSLPTVYNGAITDRRDRIYPWPLPNIWLGVSVEDQKTADERIPLLLETPAARRVISAEPLLGPIDLTVLDYSGWRLDALRGTCEPHSVAFAHIDQVIAGGESGDKARPSHPDWFRSLRDQCQQAGTAFFFKQWGNCLPCDWDGEDADGDTVYNIDEEHSSVDYDILGKGRYLNEYGREFVRFPHKNTGRTLDGRTWDEFPA